MYKLLLMVADASMLEKGTFPRHHFNKDGGFVGSDRNATWYINNLKNEIANIEFEIKFYNVDYCLIAHGNSIFINHSTAPISKGATIRLKNGDIISIANYDLKVQICTDKSNDVNLQDDLYRLVQSSNTPVMLSTNHLEYSQFENLNRKTDTPEYNELLTLNHELFELDPLILLDDNKISENECLVSSSGLRPSIVGTKGNYKVINEYINTNIESYEPILTINNRMQELCVQNSNIYKGESTVLKIDLNQTALQNVSGTIDQDVTNILDPLNFIK